MLTQKQQLQKLILDLETKNFREKQSKDLMGSIQDEQTKNLMPVFEQLAHVLMDQMSQHMATLTEKLTKTFEKAMPQIDMAETNKLLKQIKDATEQPCNVKLTLK